MMTLRQRLAWRYGLVVGICLLLLAGLTYHEFVREPEMFRRLGIKESEHSAYSELAEVFLYAVVPLVFALGWWSVRKSLKPINDLALGVERFHAQNLRARLPRTQNGDEVDRMSAAFNAMAARVEQSFQRVHEFTLHASHELKTPLTVMRAQLETLLAQSSTASGNQRDSIGNLLEEVGRLTRIVDGLSLLTKADAGLVQLSQEPVALDDVVREGSEDAEVLAHPHGIRVTLGRCDAATVGGDRHRLRQVVLNLVDNAIKYNRPGGTVEIALQRHADSAELTVRNTGRGIPPEVQARVFDRFVRGEEARSRAVEGCGLGLPIVKWIVELHGGTVSLASEPEKMTRFTIRLPLAETTENIPR